MVDLVELLTSLAHQFPEGSRTVAVESIERTAFQIELLRGRLPRAIDVIDIGGGNSLFPLACSALGMRATVVDNYDGLQESDDRVLREIFPKYGTKVLTRDVVKEPLELAATSLDVATSFDSIEHWHGSPKPVLHALKAALRPGGLMIVGVPNCVNLRKRITVPLGYGKWCGIQDWYEAPVMRSHVHEPDVEDLEYIATDLGLTKVEILGRNWIGYHHPNRFIRAATPMLDRILQLRPSLCSDLYLLGEKDN